MDILNRREISEREFSTIADVARRDNCLREKAGEHGLIYSVLLKGKVMASSDIKSDGKRSFHLHI